MNAVLWKRSAKQWRLSSRRWRRTCEELTGDFARLQRNHDRLVAELAETNGTIDWLLRQHHEMLDGVSAIIEAAKKETPRPGAR